ncbi:SDR family oxidoreductase [Nonomuraea sp. bgisy101]|uniref:SDR family oxidoreductase n=1 Tax=Nonomuraea sp. bgisy101 TaxID=3413784 RepID=UPI003D75C89A
MNILVIGATGAQGGSTARRLVGLGHAVSGFTRTGMGLPEGVKPAIGDLADASAVRAAFDGVTHASVLLPMVYEAPVVESYVRNIVAAATEAGVRRLVFNTGNRVPSGPTPVSAFETRRAAESVFAHSGVPTVVLRPPVYLDNLCAPWVAGPLVHAGVLAYPLPADVPVSWLSHGDLATATVAALTSPDLLSTTRLLALDLGGPDAVTGAELAAAFAAVLGRPVRYAAQDLGEFEAGLAHAFGPSTAEAIAGAYRWVAEKDHTLYGQNSAGLEDTLGVRLTRLHDWIASRPWKEIAR